MRARSLRSVVSPNSEPFTCPCRLKHGRGHLGRSLDLNPSLRRPSMKNSCQRRPLRSRLLLGACALLALAGTAAPALSQTAPSAPPAPSVPSAQPAPPAWVVKSDNNTQLVLDLL